MVANAPGTQGGFSASGDTKTKAGFDPVMGKPMRRRKTYASLGLKSRSRWMSKKSPF